MTPPTHRPDRTKVLLLCAGVVLLFTFADVAALGKFSPLAFGVRLVWAGLMVGAAYWLERTASESVQKALLYSVGVATSGFFALLVFLTGGANSPLFHWILAMPVLVAVIVQEAPGVTIASAGVMIASGILILAGSRAALEYSLEWAIQATAMSALAWYASSSYQKLRAKEADATREKMQALEKARQVDAEVVRREKAEEQVRSRDDFLSVASHELRTPLTSLSLNLQRLRAQEKDESAHQKLEVIERQVQRLSTLMQHLFDLSKLRHAKLRLTIEDVDLAAVATEVVMRMQVVAEQVGSELTVNAPAKVIGRWDRMRMDQVLTNLISNSIKYGAGKPIHVEVVADDSDALLSVRDQGIGIAKEDQGRIFERFERAVSSQNYGGLGLGLWIAREVVTAFGGEILVESEAGKGSTFIVRLPRKQVAAREELAH